MLHAHRLDGRRRSRSSRPLRAALTVLAMATAALTLAGLPAIAGASTHRRAHSATADGVLKRGERGSAVRRLQRALGVSADGVFGRGTERVLRGYQRRHGLTVDGVAGSATFRSLGLRALTSRVHSHRSYSLHGSTSAQLARIAACESGGDPRAVSSSGSYRGKYQFDRATWRSVGGQGDPARASEPEQDHRAAILLRRSGGSAWPNCA